MAQPLMSQHVQRENGRLHVPLMAACLEPHRLLELFSVRELGTSDSCDCSCAITSRRVSRLVADTQCSQDPYWAGVMEAVTSAATAASDKAGPCPVALPYYQVRGVAYSKYHAELCVSLSLFQSSQPSVYVTGSGFDVNSF
eukprot:jgi/Ulvmu1/12546/UM090_0033.1